MRCLVIISLLCVSTLTAQSTGEKLLWLGGASVAFSLFDYVGYNATMNEHGIAPVGYRVAQAAVQIGLSYLLYEKFGLPTAIAFNLIWWTWGCDLMYYQFGRVLPPYDQLSPNKQVTWASWTPVGLVRGGKEPIAHNTLIAQSLVGLTLAITITL